MGVWGLLLPALSWVTFQPPGSCFQATPTRPLVLWEEDTGVGWVEEGVEGVGQPQKIFVPPNKDRVGFFYFFKFQTEILLQ